MTVNIVKSLSVILSPHKKTIWEKSFQFSNKVQKSISKPLYHDAFIGVLTSHCIYVIMCCVALESC